MRDKWAFKYMNFNNFSRKKAQVKEARRVKREIRAKKGRGESVSTCLDPVISKEKDAVLRALQSRWWYALPPWPDPQVDYTASLDKKGLTVDSDSKEETKEKVQQIAGFPGLFFNARGRIYDLRDKETCPSYHNLAEKPLEELEELLLTALKGQLKELVEIQEHDKDLEEILNKKIQAMIDKAENHAKEDNLAVYAPMDEEKVEEFQDKEDNEDLRAALDDDLWR